MRGLAFGFALAICGAGCQAAVSSHPQAVRINRLGATQLAAGRLAEAELSFDLALEYAPCMAGALHNRALVALRAGRLDEAARREREALSCQDDLVQAYNGLGVVELRRGDRAEARRLFEHALALDPACLDARRNLIDLARQTGDEALLRHHRDRLRLLTAVAPTDR